MTDGTSRVIDPSVGSGIERDSVGEGNLLPGLLGSLTGYPPTPSCTLNHLRLFVFPLWP
jgi:hypothetical protein